MFNWDAFSEMCFTTSDYCAENVIENDPILCTELADNFWELGAFCAIIAVDGF